MVWFGLVRLALFWLFVGWAVWLACGWLVDDILACVGFVLMILVCFWVCYWLFGWFWLGYSLLFSF